jgi:hypothetical protein
MAKFNKGFTYLGRMLDGTNRWFIIHQVGQRSWSATCFTHAQGLDTPNHVMVLNSGALYAKFEKANILTYQVGNPEATKRMRGDMFNILKWGQRDEPQDKESPH